MNFADAALFLLLAAAVAGGCWRVAARTTDRAGAAVAGFAAFWGLAGTVIWLVGQFALNAFSCGAVLAVMICCLWFFPKPAAGTTLPNLAALLGGQNAALVFYIAAVSLLTLILALAPPNASDYDSLVYHLAVPAQYLRAGRVVQLPYDHHSYFPLTIEMLYAAGLAWRGAIFAKLFHWIMLPTGAALVAVMARRHLSLRAGLLGAALWVSLPVVQSEATTAYVDLGLAIFALGAVFCFLNWWETASDRWLVACGVFCGLCLGSKYLGALVCGWLAIWIIAVAVAQKRRLKPAMGAMALALLIGGGWYLRNWLWTGNPVFPFAYGVFGGRGWTAAMAYAYTQDQKAFGFGHTLLDAVQLPWRLSFSPLNARIVGKSVTDIFETPGMVFSSVLGPALLAFGAPLVAMRRKPRAVGFALWTMLFLFTFWSSTGQYLRYLLPAYALGCVACGYAIERYVRGGAVLKWAASASLLLWLCCSPVITFSQEGDRIPVVFGQENRQDYLRGFAGYDAMDWASNNTPPGARFAVWGEPRCYYLQRDYFFADDGHNNLIDYGKPLLPQLKTLGATHVLVNEEALTNGGFGDIPSQWTALVAGGATRELYGSRGYRVYALK